MTLPREHALAEAITNALNDAPNGTFPIAFTAIRKHIERLDTKAVADLKVTVAPISKTSTRSSRGTWNEDFGIGVGVRKKLAAGSEDEANAEGDGLAFFTEQIETFAREFELPNGELVGIERASIADPERLMEREYVAVVLLLFRAEWDAEEEED